MSNTITLADLIDKLSNYSDQDALPYLKYTMPVYPGNSSGIMLWSEDAVDKQLAHAQKLKEAVGASGVSDDVLAQFLPVGIP